MSSSSVYITRAIPESGVALLSGGGFEVTVNPLPRQLRRDELLKQVVRHDAIICQLSDPIDRAVLEASSPRCKVVATCAAGFDNIDLKAAQDCRIVVTNTPGVLTEATADLTWALLLATARRLGEAEQLVRSGTWQGWGMLDFLGADVYGKTLGIVGAGRIGTAVAKRARGFDMRVFYHARENKRPIEDLGATRVSLGELLETSDFVSLHVPFTEETRHLLDARALNRMKQGAILINTARGAVVDQVALIEALQEGHLGGAGLDVYDNEPTVPEELLKMDHVVLLPHIGSATVSTRSRMAEMAALNVAAVLQGRPPLNPVVQ